MHIELLNDFLSDSCCTVQMKGNKWFPGVSHISLAADRER